MSKKTKMCSQVLATVLVIAVLCSIANAGYVSTLRGMAGLISHWDLNETTGTTAADWQTSPLVDGNNTGTYSGTVTLGAAGPRPARRPLRVTRRPRPG